jgi:hypothetical protein
MNAMPLFPSAPPLASYVFSPAIAVVLWYLLKVRSIL